MNNVLIMRSNFATNQRPKRVRESQSSPQMQKVRREKNIYELINRSAIKYRSCERVFSFKNLLSKYIAQAFSFN